MGLVDIQAICRNCGFYQSAKNAMGLAAQHHNKYGHTVDVESGYWNCFGDSNDREFHDSDKPAARPTDLQGS